MKVLYMFVGDNVRGALLLAKDEESITTDMLFLTPETYSYTNLSSIWERRGGVSKGGVG